MSESERQIGGEMLSRAEFYEWLSNSYRQHMDRDADTVAKVDRLTVAVFGNGDPDDKGMQGDVKHLVCVSQRLDNWLDGVSRLWKILTSVVALLGATTVLAKTMGWL